MTKCQKVIDFLKLNGDSSPDTLAKGLEITKNSVYVAVFCINKNKKGQYAIHFNRIVYKLVERNTGIVYNTEVRNSVKQKIAVPIVQQQEKTSSSIGLPSSFLKKVSLLSEPDKSDTLDMLKKSYFYKKSAEALVEANTVIESLRESLNI